MDIGITYPQIRSVQPNGCCTFVTLNEDGAENLRALYPNKKLLERIRPEISAEQYEMLENLWTDEVIEMYQESLKEISGKDSI